MGQMVFAKVNRTSHRPCVLNLSKERFELEYKQIQPGFAAKAPWLEMPPASGNGHTTTPGAYRAFRTRLCA
jgi:hypothetical protein